MGEKGENFEIVQTIVTLAKTMGMNVIAEGIETAEQLAQLRKMKCEYGQGHFFSPPTDSKGVEVLIENVPHWSNEYTGKKI